VVLGNITVLDGLLVGTAVGETTAACETPFKMQFFSEVQQNSFRKKHDFTTY
jgi:hypothetical protein